MLCQCGHATVTIDADGQNISRYSLRHETLRALMQISARFEKNLTRGIGHSRYPTEEEETLRKAEEDGAALIGTQKVTTPEILPLEQRAFDDALLESLWVDEAATDQA